MMDDVHYSTYFPETEVVNDINSLADASGAKSVMSSQRAGSLPSVLQRNKRIMQKITQHQLKQYHVQKNVSAVLEQ